MQTSRDWWPICRLVDINFNGVTETNRRVLQLKNKHFPQDVCFWSGAPVVRVGFQLNIDKERSVSTTVHNGWNCHIIGSVGETRTRHSLRLQHKVKSRQVLKRQWRHPHILFGRDLNQPNALFNIEQLLKTNNLRNLAPSINIQEDGDSCQ